MSNKKTMQLLFIRTDDRWDDQDAHLVHALADAGLNFASTVVAAPADHAHGGPETGGPESAGAVVLSGSDVTLLPRPENGPENVPATPPKNPWWPGASDARVQLAYPVVDGIAGILRAARRAHLIDPDLDLLIVSDQILGPLSPLPALFEGDPSAAVRTLVPAERRTDLTESVELANPEQAGELAMELTFLTVPAKTLQHEPFWDAVDRGVAKSRGERGWLDLAALTDALTEARIEVNPFYEGGGDFFARDLDRYLSQGIPFIPWALFETDPLVLERWAVVPRAAFDYVQNSDYPMEMFWGRLLKSCPPQTWYTNLSLLDIVGDTPPRDFHNRLTTAVLAHVFYPDMLPEILKYAGNVPDPVRLIVTTDSAAKKAQMEQVLSDQARFADWQVRVVTTNRGRDVSAFLIDCEDVIRDRSVDVILKLHSKRSVQDPASVSGWFRDHLFDNLLHSPGHAAHVMQRFATEPQLGLVMAPVIHMGVPTMGNGWTLNKGPAQAMAHRLGIDIPFDTFTPLSPYGSMFYARRQALLPLVDAGFTVEEFPDAAGYRDGSVAHVLERLFSYVVFSQGYFARCVQAPSLAEVSAVALQYKYDQVSHYLFPFASRQVQMLSGGGDAALSGAAVRSLIQRQLSARYPRVGAVALGMWTDAKRVYRGVRDLLH